MWISFLVLLQIVLFLPPSLGFLRQGLLYCPGWLGTCCVAQAGLHIVPILPRGEQHREVA
jgi:hypothetical protein